MWNRNTLQCGLSIFCQSWVKKISTLAEKWLVITNFLRGSITGKTQSANSQKSCDFSSRVLRRLKKIPKYAILILIFTKKSKNRKKQGIYRNFSYGRWWKQAKDIPKIPIFQKIPVNRPLTWLNRDFLEFSDSTVRRDFQEINLWRLLPPFDRSQKSDR